MNGWLVYDKEGAKKNKGYIELYLEKAPEYDMNIELVYAEDISFGIFDGKPDVSLKRPDFVICRTIYPLLTEHFEAMEIPVFNNAHVAAICNDKARTYQYLSAHGVPILKTWFGKVPESEREYPLIIKSCNGHGGTEVYFASNDTEYEYAVSKLAHTSIVIQRPANELGKDLRVYVIGREIIASILRYNPTSFKSNYSLGGTASVYSLSLKETALVEKICKLFNFGLVGIDFVFNNGELCFNEIEDVVGARMLYANTDIDLVGRYLAYIKSRLS